LWFGSGRPQYRSEESDQESIGAAWSGQLGPRQPFREDARPMPRFARLVVDAGSEQRVAHRLEVFRRKERIVKRHTTFGQILNATGFSTLGVKTGSRQVQAVLRVTF